MMDSQLAAYDELEREENIEIFNELQRRRQEVIEGKVTCITVDELFEQLRSDKNG
ncbi:MAG: hypothetical protein FWD27_04970 [Coriobacteriia bacterium]|nr:hypothetical protein [Coriobacteriia bacterium]